MANAKRILILDDDLIVRQSLKYYFDDRLWNTLVSTSGEEALDLLKELDTCSIVVDIRLPGMNGNEFIREACKLNKLFVFAICSGSSDYLVPEDILRLPNVSNHFYRKPIIDIGEIESELIRLFKDSFIAD